MPGRRWKAYAVPPEEAGGALEWHFLTGGNPLAAPEVCVALAAILL